MRAMHADLRAPHASCHPEGSGAEEREEGGSPEGLYRSSSTTSAPQSSYASTRSQPNAARRAHCAGEKTRTNPTPPTTILIPAGPFTMGDDNHLARRAARASSARQRVPASPLCPSPTTTTPPSSTPPATKRRASGTTPRFNAPDQPVVAVTLVRRRRLLRLAVAPSPARTTACPPRPSGRRRRAAASKARMFPWGDRAVRRGGRFAQDATWQVGARRPERLRPDRHRLQRPRVVLRLVRRRLLRRLARPRPARPAHRQAARLSRRRLASPGQGQPLLRPQQHPARLPLQRLRLPRRAIR